MPWKFDPLIEDLIWTQSPDLIKDGATIDFEEGDLAIDMGDRSNDSSVIDQGSRIFEV
jgi:hypothetical protein